MTFPSVFCSLRALSVFSPNVRLFPLCFTSKVREPRSPQSFERVESAPVDDIQKRLRSCSLGVTWTCSFLTSDQWPIQSHEQVKQLLAQRPVSHGKLADPIRDLSTKVSCEACFSDLSEWPHPVVAASQKLGKEEDRPRLWFRLWICVASSNWRPSRFSDSFTNKATKSDAESEVTADSGGDHSDEDFTEFTELLGLIDWNSTWKKEN